MKSSQDTLLTSLNDLGIIQHFEDNNLKDVLILNPEWLTNAVYKIINSEEIAKNKGLLKLGLLSKILKGEKTNNLDYPANKFRYIIDLMMKFELCYEIDDNNVLFHNLLEVEAPRIDFNYADSFRFVIEYNFMPKKVMPLFIVKMFKDIKDDLRWRTGVVLENKALQVSAVIKADEEKNIINIWIDGKLKREYFSAIRNVFKEINESFERLKVVEKIPCNCSQCVEHPEFYEYSNLLKRQEKGQNIIECPRSIEEVSIADLLSGINPRIDIEPDESQDIIIKEKDIELEKRREIKNINTNKNYNYASLMLYELWEEAFSEEKKGNLTEAFNKYEKIIHNYQYFLNAWGGIERFYNKKGDLKNRTIATEKIKYIREIIDFETNAESKIMLDQFQINDLYFFENFQWNFQPQINILLGKNGYGKTLLLRLLISMLQKETNLFDELFYLGKERASAKLSVRRNNQSKEIIRTKTAFNESIGQIPVLAIPDSRYVNKARSTIGRIDSKYTDIRQHSAYHFLTEEPYEDMLNNFLYQLCIEYGFTKEKQDSSIFKLIQNIVKELTDNSFEIKNIKPAGKAEFRIEVLTEGNDEDNLLPIQKASQGTLSVLSIFGQIYNFLKSIDPDMPNNELLNKPAIVFIDELDAHLHPAWQQKIIGLLRENFPNVQFVVSAYNPLIVAGCFENEVAVLRKGEGGFSIKQYERDFIGCEAKELYQMIFEIEEKDENYLKYSALQPFKEEILSEISKLEKIKKKRELSEDEKTKLKELISELKYIEKASKASDTRNQLSELMADNRRLKQEMVKIKKIYEQIKKESFSIIR